VEPPPAVGYDVVFVGFDDRGNVKPTPPVRSSAGSSRPKAARMAGRLVAFAKDGALLVSDDVGGVIWRVVAPARSRRRRSCRSRPRRCRPAAAGCQVHRQAERRSDLLKPQP
jgi:hypothetical protein